MIGHAEARERVSARADGELEQAFHAELDEHLATCHDCSAFAAGVLGLRELTRALPRLEPRPLRPAQTKRQSLRLLPALAAALALGMIAVVIGGPGTFSVRIAAAAEPLTTLRTFYAERHIVTQDGSIDEKIWFRAPGDVRIERRSVAGEELIIERPGERYRETSTERSYETGLPPDADVLPEPLSPSIVLIGRNEGPGPVILGRPTVRYAIDLGNGRARIAFVDERRYTALGVDQSFVLDKLAAVNGQIGGEKRTVAFRINGPITDAMFEIPSVPSTDAGFRDAPLSALAVRPRALPQDFHLVAAGTGPGGSTMLFARGAYPIQVDVATRQAALDENTTRTHTLTIGATTATIVEDLYKLPRIMFTVDGRFVTITAPMGRDDLVRLARTMFHL
jgi:hypothetical protein